MDSITLKTPFSSLENPSKKHKDWYREEFLKIFCDEINPHDKSFSNTEFQKEFKRKYLPLELKQRLTLIADLFDKHCNLSFSKKLKLLEKLLYKKWPLEEGMFNYGFHLYPVSQFIEIHATEDLEKSLDFLEKLTQRFTSEWAIRTIANADKALTLKRMKKWAKDDNFHVRRLASEGLRPRLPWGKQIEWISENPATALPIYNKLRNDKSLYVRRSVANSMGDIIKIDEKLALSTFDSWLKKKITSENLWVIKHAIRTPVKKNNQVFLKLRAKIDKIAKKL